MLNKLILQGRLTANVEPKTTQNGTTFAEFTVAWSEKIKETENKCFMRCKAWGNTATFLEKFFVKGQELLIEGQMRTEEWEKDGQRQSRTICNIEKVNFCGSAKDNTTPKKATASATLSIDDYEEIEENFPF